MKKFIVLVLALVCVMGLVGCNTKSMNYIIENKPSVTGIVEEVHDDYIIIYSETADGYPNGSNWSISLNGENKDSYTDVVVGDEIIFYYDGMAMETDPLQVSTVYAITLKTPADCTINETMEETESSEEVIVGGDLIPMVMVNDKIYMDTGHESTIEVRCGMMDGEITSTVDRTEQPTQDNESNFGTGYGYQYGTQEGLIEIYINDKWCVFATEKALASSQLMIGQEAWIIPMNDSCEWEVNWEWLYGALPEGKYRISKEISDFRATGDYDKAIYFAEFEITK